MWPFKNKEPELKKCERSEFRPEDYVSSFETRVTLQRRITVERYDNHRLSPTRRLLSFDSVEEARNVANDILLKVAEWENR